MNASQVLISISKRHLKDYFITECKNGPTQWGTHLRLDAVAIARSWANPCITGYEVKVSRGDFKADKKWEKYLPYCNRFYFACPEGMIRPAEIPDGVGLIWCKEDGGWCVKRTADWHKIELDPDFLMYIIMCRLDKDRIPFYSDRREAIRQYVQNRIDGRELYQIMRKKYFSELDDCARQKLKLTQLEERSNVFDQITHALTVNGRLKWWGASDERILDAVKELIKESWEIRKTVKEETV